MLLNKEWSVEGLYEKAATIDDLANINIEYLRGKRTLYYLSCNLLKATIIFREMGFFSASKYEILRL